MTKEEHLKNIEKCEKNFLDIQTKHFRFSKNLIKYYDDIVFDMWDHNFFKHNRKTTMNEVIDAYTYQHDHSRDFLKFISDDKLNKRIVDRFNMEKVVTLTMLYDTSKDLFKINKDVKIKNITLKDLNKIELKHYEAIYGKGFIQRRNKSFIKLTKTNPNFVCYGAYLNGEIVGSCYSYTHNGYTCIDSLLVDDKYRNQYIASTLLKYIITNSKHVYLHADDDDTPKQMYKKLGFKTLKRTYEYYKKVEI